MTPSSKQDAPRDFPGGVLASLISCDTGTFAADHWGRRPLLSRAPGSLQSVLTVEDIDELLSSRGLRTPFVKLTRDGVVAANSAFTSGGGAGATIADQVSDTKLVDLLLDGTTVVLQAVHRTFAPVASMVSLLSAELAVPVQANVYVTPAEARGFDAHYDVHDVFVLQLHGTKHWRVHAPVFTDPLPDQPWGDRRAEVAARAEEEPLLDVVLSPGDVLYLPRGAVHGAVSRDGVSAHLTLGLHPVTAHAAAGAALGLLKDRPELRASLPVGLRLDAPEAADALAAVVKDLHAALDALPPEAIARALAATVLPQTRPVPVGPLAQASAAAAFEAAASAPSASAPAATGVRLRPGLQTFLAGGDLLTPFGPRTVEAADLPALQQLLRGEAVTEPGAAARFLRLGIAVPA